MINPKVIQENLSFVGRSYERAFLQNLIALNERLPEALIVILYGRRRVGKTELIEQTFRERNVLKFEGIEGKDSTFQRQHVLGELSKYAEEPLLTKITTSRWLEVFELIYSHVTEGKWTLYFEEVQWLANYETEFIAELKYAWDNFFKNNPKLIIILCGSSPSFMIEKVLKSKALYNRSQYELPLKPFSLKETQQFLSPRSSSEVMDAYLIIGGVPEYLKRANLDSSILLSIAKQSFVPGGFFTHEYERIFTSSLASSPNYKKIIEFLSKNHFATRPEIQKHLKVQTGGSLSNVLIDLEECGFIESYTPFDAGENSKLTRYAVSDAYLQFYYKFIHPKQKAIEAGEFIHNPLSALDMTSLEKWKGFAFERFCRSNHKLIAKILGFDAVNYRHGAYFNRALSAEDAGFQMDLIFERADKVYTICEIKYLQSPASKKVIEDFERKLSRFKQHGAKHNYSMQRVLISPSGTEDSLVHAYYFDRILMLEDFLAHFYDK